MAIVQKRIAQGNSAFTKIQELQTAILHMGQCIIWVRNMVLEEEGEKELSREEKRIFREIRQRNVNCIGYILRRDCLQKIIIERKMHGRKGTR